MPKPSAYNIFGGGVPELRTAFTAHSGQAEVTDAIHKAVMEAPPGMDPFLFMIIGSRGWGKTLYLVCEILLPFVAAMPNGRVMWVGPKYQTALAFVDEVLKGEDEVTEERWVPEFDERGNRVWEFVSMTPSGPQVRFWNGCTVTVKSADSPDSIVGRGYNLIIIDEAAMIAERVFTQQIAGTARKRGIKLFIITSPRGKRHWTYKYYMKGQDPADPRYMSFRQPWWKNPTYSEELKEFMKTLPRWVVQQEYEAEFLEEGDSVFKGLGTVIVGPEISFLTPDQEWDAGPITDLVMPLPEGKTKIIPANQRRFCVGLDLAKQSDFTVFYVMDMLTGECMYYRRFNKTGYDIVLKMAAQICHRFNDAELIYDATGVGSGLGDFFDTSNVSPNPYIFTNESKNELINTLAVSIEYGQIKIPNIATMVHEMSVFTYEVTRTMKISYNAPDGEHDDIVIAMALANWYRKQNSMGTDVSAIDNFLAANTPQPQDFRKWMLNDND